jgi:hypothetical protein
MLEETYTTTGEPHMTATILPFAARSGHAQVHATSAQSSTIINPTKPVNHHQSVNDDIGEIGNHMFTILKNLPNVPAKTAGVMSGELAEIRMRLSDLAVTSAHFNPPPRRA